MSFVRPQGSTSVQNNFYYSSAISYTQLLVLSVIVMSTSFGTWMVLSPSQVHNLFDAESSIGETTFRNNSIRNHSIKFHFPVNPVPFQSDSAESGTTTTLTTTTVSRLSTADTDKMVEKNQELIAALKMVGEALFHLGKLFCYSSYGMITLALIVISSLWSCCKASFRMVVHSLGYAHSTETGSPLRKQVMSLNLPTNPPNVKIMGGVMQGLPYHWIGACPQYVGLVTAKMQRDGNHSNFLKAIYHYLQHQKFHRLAECEAPSTLSGV